MLVIYGGLHVATHFVLMFCAFLAACAAQSPQQTDSLADLQIVFYKKVFNEPIQ